MCSKCWLTFTRTFWIFTSGLSSSLAKAVGHTNDQSILVPTNRTIFIYVQVWKISFKVGIHTFGDMFGDVIKKLERSRELLLNSAHIAHFQESQEARLLFTKAFDAELERTKKDRMLTITDWLSPTSCYADHEEQQRKRHGFPRTTRWMFSESSMCRWLQQGGSSNCSFWIRGIPGAGMELLFLDL